MPTPIIFFSEDLDLKTLKLFQKIFWKQVSIPSI